MSKPLTDKALRAMIVHARSRPGGFGNVELRAIAVELAAEVLKLRKVARQFKRLRERAMLMGLRAELDNAMKAGKS